MPKPVRVPSPLLAYAGLVTPADLSLTVLRAVRRAVGDGVLAVREVPSRVVVERPRAGGAGTGRRTPRSSSPGPPRCRPGGSPRCCASGCWTCRASSGSTSPDPGSSTSPSAPTPAPRPVGSSSGASASRGCGTGTGGALGRLPEDEVRFPVPDGADLRLRVLTDCVVALLRSQGAPARVIDERAAGRVADGRAPAPTTGDRALAPATDSRDRAQPASDSAPARVIDRRTSAQPTGAAQPTGDRLPNRTPGDGAAQAPDRRALARATPTPNRPTPRLHPVVPPHYDVAAVLPPDAVRWALLRPAAHDRVLDAAPLLRLTEAGGNGLFAVQYAHARSRALLRNAADLGFTGAYEEEVDASELLAALADHPAVLLAAARQHAPDRLARHLEAVADALLGFQHTVLPVGEEKPSAAHRSRLALAEAAGTVLAGGLSLLGVSAPDRL
ncbi:DALR anticodon-binding domain-containing protein [Streptomyces sudanensis]|uniref:DALR anticodon-binding domain-containing protein n=1 Tax=Streptomyces sudanensis TaxID=436397 RepID=UPI0020CD6316|nr:DALR anticodon-binding domain-containing protein [Streptomyces sudanensis]MCQ0002164.1 DALR anticodon-binding domain-containing protein [Streptomyces sudanensis]